MGAAVRFLMVVVLDWRPAIADAGRGATAALFAANGEGSSSGSAGCSKTMGCFFRVSDRGASPRLLSASDEVTLVAFRCVTRLFVGLLAGVGAFLAENFGALIVDCVLETGVGFGKGGRMETDAARALAWGFRRDGESLIYWQLE